MKSMIPFLMAVLPAASVAQSQPGAPQAPSGAALPATTKVMVILTAKQGVTRQQIMAVMPSEIRATVKLYLDGKIRQWDSRGDAKGVAFLIDAKTEDEARAVMDTPPLAKEQLMDHEYIPVGPLMPLMALMLAEEEAQRRQSQEQLNQALGLKSGAAVPYPPGRERSGESRPV